METNNLNKVTNLDYLKELSKGDVQFVNEMIDIFLTENPEEIKQLEKGVNEKNFDAIRAFSHKLKSTIPFVGLDKIIGKEVAEIETLSRDKVGIEQIETLFLKVKTMCLKANEELGSNV